MLHVFSLPPFELRDTISLRVWRTVSVESTIAHSASPVGLVAIVREREFRDSQSTRLYKARESGLPRSLFNPQNRNMGLTFSIDDSSGTNSVRCC
jgi:hypothetical protein